MYNNCGLIPSTKRQSHLYWSQANSRWTWPDQCLIEHSQSRPEPQDDYLLARYTVNQLKYNSYINIRNHKSNWKQFNLVQIFLSVEAASKIIVKDWHIPDSSSTKSRFWLFISSSFYRGIRNETYAAWTSSQRLIRKSKAMLLPRGLAAK